MQSIANDNVHVEVLAPITHAGVQYAPGAENVFLPEDAFTYHADAGSVKRASRKKSSDEPVDPAGIRVQDADPALAGVPEYTATTDDAVAAPGLDGDGMAATRSNVTQRTTRR